MLYQSEIDQNTKIGRTNVINIYKHGYVGISSNLIGLLSLANGQWPLPERWMTCRVKHWPFKLWFAVVTEEILQMLHFVTVSTQEHLVLSLSLYMVC